MKSTNPQNEYIPLNINISVKRSTLRLLIEMADDMGISINDVLSFLAEDSVIDLQIDETFENVYIPDKCSPKELRDTFMKKKLS